MGEKHCSKQQKVVLRKHKTKSLLVENKIHFLDWFSTGLSPLLLAWRSVQTLKFPLIITVDGETGSKRVKNRGESKSKGAVKKKRNRSHFTQLQLKYLEDVFSRQQYLTRDERALLANGLEMTELQIRNWFQNRRYQLRHRGMNRPRQVPVKVLVSSNSAQAPQDWERVDSLRFNDS